MSEVARGRVGDVRKIATIGDSTCVNAGVLKGLDSLEALG